MREFPPEMVEVLPDGTLRLSANQRIRWGLAPGSRVVARQTPTGLFLYPEDPPLQKAVIEPTSACNLNCRSCVRRSWSEPVGTMPWELFERLAAGLSRAPALHTVAFWGMGEPLLHPRIADMVAAVKRLGAETELITNGSLLDAEKAGALIAAGLDRLIVSVDGATPQTHSRNRAGADLERIKENVATLRRLRRRMQTERPTIGLEFVLMRRNLDQVPLLRRLASEIEAAFIIVTHLLPYTEEMKEEILYWLSADRPWSNRPSALFPRVSVPRIDARRENLAAFNELIWSGFTAEPIQEPPRNPEADGHCPFVERGTAAVAWDGGVSPCVALMHSYRCFVLGREKTIRRYTLGNAAEEELLAIWNQPEYREFRRRVLDFDFSPCIHCGGCDFADSNQEDCFGNRFPTCGDCLWARNIIVCP